MKNIIKIDKKKFLNYLAEWFDTRKPKLGKGDLRVVELVLDQATIDTVAGAIKEEDHIHSFRLDLETGQHECWLCGIEPKQEPNEECPKCPDCNDYHKQENNFDCLGKPTKEECKHEWQRVPGAPGFCKKCDILLVDKDLDKPTKPEPLNYQMGKFEENFVDMGIKVNEIIQYLKERDS
jgi:hypothetical protein